MRDDYFWARRRGGGISRCWPLVWWSRKRRSVAGCQLSAGRWGRISQPELQNLEMILALSCVECRVDTVKVRPCKASYSTRTDALMDLIECLDSAGDVMMHG